MSRRQDVSRSTLSRIAERANSMAIHLEDTDRPAPGSWTDLAVEDAYRVLLRTIDKEVPEDAVLTSHWPLIGNASDRLLVVGQAVFGWVPTWRPDDVAYEDGVSRVLRASQAVFCDLPDSMQWIAGSRARSSPFWRTVKTIVDRTYAGSPEPWYSHVAWANIYPVAPNDIKGNPEGPLRWRQTVPAANLLDLIARSLQPDAVLVLGGVYWWDVAELLPLDNPTAVQRPLLARGTRGAVPWIAGMHPGGAQRRGWSAGSYADSIVESLR